MVKTSTEALNSLVDNSATEATLAKLTGLSGAGVDTTLTLTSATTAYACPASAPTSAYVLLLTNDSDTAIYIRTTTGTTAGQRIGANGGTAEILLAGSQVLYVYSAGTGKILNVSTKIL